MVAKSPVHGNTATTPQLNKWTTKKLYEKIEYCHWNPVKRELVKSPEQWRWSSYRWIVLKKREGEPIRIDA